MQGTGGAVAQAVAGRSFGPADQAAPARPDEPHRPVCGPRPYLAVCASALRDLVLQCVGVGVGGTGGEEVSVEGGGGECACVCVCMCVCV